MNNIEISGKIDFMGTVIPVVSGGFGSGKRCVSDKTIAEIHNMPVFKVRERINGNLSRFKEGIDFIDLKKGILQTDTLLELGYSKQSVAQAEHIYILSERGYGKLIKIMDTDKAWEVYDKLLDEYFTLKEAYTLPKTYADALRELADKSEETERLKAQNMVLIPKAEVCDNFLTSSGGIPVDALAKELGIESIGRNKMYSLLREIGLIEKYSNPPKPYQKYVSNGWFIVKPVVYEHNGTRIQSYKTMVTSRGVIGIRMALKKMGVIRDREYQLTLL